MNNIPKELIKKLIDGQVILFVGAGVSRSLGLPSYAELISKIGIELGFDPELFHSYADFYTLAEYYRLEVNKLSELNARLKDEWRISYENLRNSAIHTEIVKLGCKLIYTTNFDRLLEDSHRANNVRYRAIRGAKDLAQPLEEFVQIIKFHGDFSGVSSLVFTESDYFDRLAFNSPLDIKLKSDMLGKNLLFIGYSLTDINVRYLLYNLQKLWDKEVQPHLRPKSYVFFDRPNVVQERVLLSRGVQAIVGDTVNPKIALLDFLKELVSEKNLHKNLAK